MTAFALSPAKSGVLRGYVVTCDNEAVRDLVVEAIGLEAGSTIRGQLIRGLTVTFTCEKRRFVRIDENLSALKRRLDGSAKRAFVADLAHSAGASAAAEASAATRVERTTQTRDNAVRIIVPVEDEAPATIARDGKTLTLSGHGRTWFIRHDDFSVHGIDPSSSGEVHYAYYR